MPDDNRSWLADVVIVNDNKDYKHAGDISIYRNAKEAWQSLELWHFADEELFALNGLGYPVSFRVSNRPYASETKQPGFAGRVFKRLCPVSFGTLGVPIETLGELAFVIDNHPGEPDLDTLTSWLSATAKHILDVRRQKAQEKHSDTALGDLETKDVLPATIEGLIAYIGFKA